MTMIAEQMTALLRMEMDAVANAIAMTRTLVASVTVGLIRWTENSS